MEAETDRGAGEAAVVVRSLETRFRRFETDLDQPFVVDVLEGPVVSKAGFFDDSWRSAAHRVDLVGVSAWRAAAAVGAGSVQHDHARPPPFA